LPRASPALSQRPVALGARELPACADGVDTKRAVRELTVDLGAFTAVEPAQIVAALAKRVRVPVRVVQGLGEPLELRGQTVTFQAPRRGGVQPVCQCVALLAERAGVRLGQTSPRAT
jgi:hypothetical protein